MVIVKKCSFILIGPSGTCDSCMQPIADSEIGFLLMYWFLMFVFLLAHPFFHPSYLRWLCLYSPLIYLEIYLQDDDSDLDCEMEVVPPVNNEAVSEASACVKVDNDSPNCYFYPSTYDPLVCNCFLLTLFSDD